MGRRAGAAIGWGILHVYAVSELVGYMQTGTVGLPLRAGIDVQRGDVGAVSSDGMERLGMGG